MSNGFQTQVTNQPAPAVAGDFASTNPMWTYDSGPGGLVAGSAGVTVGRFAWAVAPSDGDGAPATVSNNGAGAVSGFVARLQQALITTYLADASMVIAAGFQMGLFTGGDFWVKNDGSTQALQGQKAYANFADGKVTFAATATPTAGATSSASTIAAKTATLTASLLGDILTVTAASGDPLVVGATKGTATGVATGTQIVAQLSGTAGGIGTYAVSIPEQNVASESMTFTYGLLTVGGTVAGTFGVGNALSGSGISATTITALGTGVGGAGTYYVNKTQTVSSQEIDAAYLNVETKWTCMSSGLPGELVKISSQPLG